LNSSALTPGERCLLRCAGGSLDSQTALSQRETQPLRTAIRLPDMDGNTATRALPGRRLAENI